MFCNFYFHFHIFIPFLFFYVKIEIFHSIFTSTGVLMEQKLLAGGGARFSFCKQLAAFAVDHVGSTRSVAVASA
jgi:hypothetical protein